MIPHRCHRCEVIGPPKISGEPEILSPKTKSMIDTLREEYERCLPSLDGRGREMVRKFARRPKGSDSECHECSEIPAGNATIWRHQGSWNLTWDSGSDDLEDSITTIYNIEFCPYCGHNLDDPPTAWYRTDGSMICNTCNKEYYKHPRSRWEWLREICNGDLVKL